MIKRETKTAIDIGLELMLSLAIGRHVRPGSGSRQLGWRAVLVCSADKEHLVANLPTIAGVDVGRQERAGEIAQVFDVVDVRECARDEYLRHGALLWASHG